MALIALFCAPQLRADGVDTFTFAESIGSQDLIISWTLPASPTSSELTVGSDSFTISTVTGTYSFGGTTTDFSDIFTFRDSATAGGLIDATGSMAFNLVTPALEQFFTGSLRSPTFTPGTFDVINFTQDGTDVTGVGTLAISTPEPSVLLLFCVGLCTMLLVSFRNRLSA